MGDLASVFVPPATTTSTPATAAAEGPAARCRRVHFLDDFPSSSALCRRLPPPTDDDGNPMAEEAGPEKKETGADEPAEDEDSTMDLLWEDFNEELPATHRATRGSVSFSSVSSSSDDPEDHSDTAPARAPGAVCFPVLRPSARAAGGAGHYRRRAGTWVLLVRIFRRLFVIDKTTVDSSAASAARRHATSS